MVGFVLGMDMVAQPTRETASSPAAIVCLMCWFISGFCYLLILDLLHNVFRHRQNCSVPDAFRKRLRLRNLLACFHVRGFDGNIVFGISVMVQVDVMLAADFY